ncbi:MAG: glycosyltransferase family 2 protein [Chloroflexota bacterium]
MSRPSISAFFPAYNDGGTIASMVLSALRTLRTLTDDYEVIVVNDGSADYTAEMLEELARLFPDHVRIVTHVRNRGYGGALRSGFAHCTKELIFYTDGDAQYDVRELVKLYEALTPDVDMVNGWKLQRHDPFHRKVIGAIYNQTIKLLFGLKYKDIDCDFRLIRRHVFDKVYLESNSGVICLEMMKKIQEAGFKVAEVPVHHYHRVYGVSQFFNFRRIFNVAKGVLRLWWKLVVRKELNSVPAERLGVRAMLEPDAMGRSE